MQSAGRGSGRGSGGGGAGRKGGGAARPGKKVASGGPSRTRGAPRKHGSRALRDGATGTQCREEGGSLAKEVIGSFDVWRVVADRLPLWERAMCSRVCKDWRKVVEEDGFDYGVATLCCALGREGNDLTEEQLDAWRERVGDDRMGDIEMFLEVPSCYEDLDFHSPESWLKLALVATDTAWIHEGAKRTRIEFDWGACELGWGRVHYLVLAGNVEGVRGELEGGHDVREAAKGRVTLLHLAAMCGRAEVVCELLERGGRVDAKDCKDSTPLHLAAEYGNGKCVRELLVRGAEANARTYGEKSPLHLAASCGDAECVRELLEGGADKEATDWDGNNPLHVAAKAGHVACLRELLQRKAKTNPKGWYQATPLHLAAEHGHLECVRELLSRKASVNAQTQFKAVPALLAAKHGHVECLRALLETEEGKGVGKRDPIRCNIIEMMYFAISEGHAECVVELLAKGADTEGVFKGQTPLHHAAEWGDAACVRELLARGADIEAKSEAQRMTPLHFASTHFADYDDEGKFTECLRELLEGGADTEAKDVKGGTPLHHAAGVNYPSSVRKLLEGGANIHAKDERGMTPLHRAAEYGSDLSLGELLKWGADVNARMMDSRKQTPLALAAYRCGRRGYDGFPYPQCVRLLRKAGGR